MTRIRFYSNATDRMQAAGQWLTSAWRERKPVLVFAPEANIAARLDIMLWTQAATGFVPHCRAPSPLTDETPIVIADSLENSPHDGCLLNLSNELPTGFSRFSEVVEIVSTDDAVRIPARDRFRFYRERGYELDNRSVAEGF